MRYKYKQFPLPNGKFDWVAVLLIQVSRGSKITTQFEALIDSGATNCLFHSDVAAAIGIKDFKSGIVSQTGGVVSGSTMDLYAHDIRLHIGADNFKITGYFSDQLPLPCLLGRSGFFENYIVTFDPTETNPGFELTRVLRA
ncbi:MAG TPA: retropepsin-like aspartic protease [Candidatus Angelobacter sp.]|nr:retropepsin-like aspartic protease [Candidatus Angelobacter sp.]